MIVAREPGVDSGALPMCVRAGGRSVLGPAPTAAGTSGSAPRIDDADFFVPGAAAGAGGCVAIFCDGSRGIAALAAADALGAAGGSVDSFCDGSRAGRGGATAICSDGSSDFAIGIGPDGSATDIPTAGVFSSPNASISSGSASRIPSVGGGGSGAAPVGSAARAGLLVSIAGSFSGGTTSLTSPANHADGSTMSPLLGICGTCATAATTCGVSGSVGAATGFMGCVVFVAGAAVLAAGAAGFAARLAPRRGGSFTGPDGGTLIGAGVGSLRADSLRSSGDGATTLVGTLSASPVTPGAFGCARASGCVAPRGGGVLAGGGFGKLDFAVTGTASASGLSSGSGASASLPPGVAGSFTAGIPIIVPVDDLALRMTRPFDHRSNV